MSYEVVNLPGGDTIMIEMADEGGPTKAGLGAAVGEKALALREEAKKVGLFLAEFRSELLDQMIEYSPDVVELEVGVSFSQEVGGLIAKSAANAQIKVKMTWKADAN